MSLSLSFSRCTALFFLLRVSPTGFTAEVLMRPLGLYVFHFSSFMAFLCRSVLLACLLPRSAARGEVLQYLTRSALSHVESRHIRVFRLFTFPAFLSKTRQYTQDFIVPSNFHHNLDKIRDNQAQNIAASTCSNDDAYGGVRNLLTHGKLRSRFARPPRRVDESYPSGDRESQQKSS